MNATELKLEDWVAYKGEPAKVYALDLPIIYVITKDEEHYGAFADDKDKCIAPILLTKEILAKNGWTYYGTQRYWEYQGEYEFTLVHRTGKGFEIEQVPYITFQYVHELQHILWALGMDDDLKI